mgnify:CR=1 FL=1
MARRYQKKEQRLFKEKVRNIFLLAEVVTRYMTRDEKADTPHPWEYYPELFEEDEKIFKEEKEREELEEYKEARRAYAAEFNRRRQQE